MKIQHSDLFTLTTFQLRSNQPFYRAISRDFSAIQPSNQVQAGRFSLFQSSFLVIDSQITRTVDGAPSNKFCSTYCRKFFLYQTHLAQYA